MRLKPLYKNDKNRQFIFTCFDNFVFEMVGLVLEAARVAAWCLACGLVAFWQSWQASF